LSLPPAPWGPVPEETARVARAAFPKGTLYLRLRDELGPLYDDALFTDLFPSRGQPAEAPWRLALVTILQFAENLPDRQAAEAVRSRIDWKYLLGLELTDSGFDATVLCEFRARLVAGAAEQRLLDRLLTLARERGLLKPRGRQRTDSTHVLAAIHVLNRLECVGETLRHALNSLAVVAPEWLREQVPADWYERYGSRVDNYRLPKADAEREALAELIGVDGGRLLAAVWAPAAPSWLRQVPASGGFAPRRSADRLALRPGGSLRRQTRPGLDRLQDPPHRNLRRRPAPSDHPCRVHAGVHHRCRGDRI